MDWQKWINLHKFVIHKKHGRFAEWLGAGLQNQLQRFESATDLNSFQTSHLMRGLFCCGADFGAFGASFGEYLLTQGQILAYSLCNKLL